MSPSVPQATLARAAHPRRVPKGRTASASASQAWALWTLAALALVAFLKLAAELLIPIVLGLLIALALEPIVAWLTRRRMPRGMASALVLVLLLLALGGGAYSVRDNLGDAVDALPSLIRRTRQKVEAVVSTRPLREVSRELRGTATETAPSGGNGLVAAGPAAGRIGATLVAALGHATVLVFFLFFLLQSGPRMARRVVEAAGTPERRALITTILADVNVQVQRFLLVTAFTAGVVAAATWLVLVWMGVAYAVLWATLAGLFNSIPYFGPIVVSAGMFLVGMTQPGGVTQAWQMAGATLAITSLEGWLITPPLMGRAERMNVLSVFLGLLVWTWLWGAWGTLLAVPMLVVVKSLADHVEPLRPLGRLLAK